MYRIYTKDSNALVQVCENVRQKQPFTENMKNLNPPTNQDVWMHPVHGSRKLPFDWPSWFCHSSKQRFDVFSALYAHWRVFGTVRLTEVFSTAVILILILMTDSCSARRWRKNPLHTDKTNSAGQKWRCNKWNLFVSSFSVSINKTFSLCNILTVRIIHTFTSSSWFSQPSFLFVCWKMWRHSSVTRSRCTSERNNRRFREDFSLQRITQ